ncbi:translation initiation factor eIF4A [Sphagnurus paluster]|uniref:RNA helicase n=1 Tax=Sphagnurus paluster TaxID=117069 RepID=A0A9P7FLI0_9AGAR|nr:translation initiation factor eIF4A [Sphagnurus paluster]
MKREESQLQDVNVDEIESNCDQVVDSAESRSDELWNSFDDMDLKPELLRGIYAYGLERPSAIQQRAIVPIVKGRDFITQAELGTGKTATFSVSILQRLEHDVKGTQALILTYTRDLALQTHKVIVALGDSMNIQSLVCIGGTNVREDMAKLRDGVQVVVGTPGRTCDMIKRGALKTDTIKIVCVDDANETLSRGFKDQIYKIFQSLPRNIQVTLFSATMPEEVLEFSKKFMRDPVRILVKKDELTFEGIKQFYISVKEDRKLDTLCDLYKTVPITRAVIFCNTRRKVLVLTDAMLGRGFTVSAMHGKMEPKQREDVIKEFCTGSAHVLITTDLAHGTINIRQVSLVINYDLPAECLLYNRRIGRGGPSGRKGVAISFVTTKHVPTLREIESECSPLGIFKYHPLINHSEFYHIKIDEMPLNSVEWAIKLSEPKCSEPTSTL